MFKSFLFSILIFTTVINSQDFSGIRIYINPGHGGHDSNDRYIAATGFWESEGNLGKGLHLKSILDSLNATTKISRTTNNTSDDLGLSVISADANNFDADVFQSIHSNATGITAKRNTTLLLFQGTDDVPIYPDSKVLGNLLATEIMNAHRTTRKSVRGDATFYGTGEPYLGVFKWLIMPGTLSEGSFHDYIPESWRLRNDLYLKHEAWAITKAFIEYFDLNNLPYGEIAGVLRDKVENVDYYYLSATADSKVPINFVKATLIPDNKIVNGDEFNNGFYMFDKIAPGTYDVILEAENYEADTVFSVVVSAGKTTFVDKNLVAKPDYSPPVVETFLPSETENIRLDSDITVDFNVKMDRIATEIAFNISPSVKGTIIWQNNDKRLIFSPSEFLKGGTNYKVTVNIFAKSAYNVLIAESFSRTFVTKSALNLVKSYPQNNSTDISTSVKIVCLFDSAIDDISLGGNVYFQDLAGKDVTIEINEVDYEGGEIIFEPAELLEPNKGYKIILLNGITDPGGSNLAEDISIEFFTEGESQIEGNEIVNFDDITNWWQPNESGSTTGIDSEYTTFSSSTFRSVGGSNSGKLKYKFVEDSLGICRLYFEDEPAISANNFGMYIYGDISSNIIEYWFRDEQGTNIPILVDTLNWSGWKFKELDVSSYSNIKFHSIVVKQNKLGENTGELYFDSILMDVLLTGLDQNVNEIPSEIKLYQNYPNPFNPTTIIKYLVPQKIVSKNGNNPTLVNLDVFDVLGRKVKELVNNYNVSGQYEVSFDASELPSGVYYYQLRIGNNSISKKMLLLK